MKGRGRGGLERWRPDRHRASAEIQRESARQRYHVRRVQSTVQTTAVHRERGRSIKHRALRADTGNFSWGSEVCTRKTRILDVVYNASNNELVRTKTLVKNAIVQVDATPFRQWYEAHYGVSVGRKKKQVEEGAEPEAPKKPR